MPELPEVENVRATLAELVIGKEIDQVIVGVPKMIVGMPAEQFVGNMIGQKIEAVRRRGKFLLIDTTDGTLLSHLRMEGKYRLNNATDPVDKHTHVTFHFTDNTELRYLDVRKFGTMELVLKGQEGLTKSIQKLGPEPLSATFEKNRFCDEVKKNQVAPSKQCYWTRALSQALGIFTQTRFVSKRECFQNVLRTH